MFEQQPCTDSLIICPRKASKTPSIIGFVATDLSQPIWGVLRMQQYLYLFPRKIHTMYGIFVLLQGRNSVQAGFVWCCRQKNMLTGHRVDRKISFCFFSLYCRVVSGYHHTHVHRSRASLYLEYSCLNKPTTQKKWAKIFVVGCIFFLFML